MGDIFGFGRSSSAPSSTDFLDDIKFLLSSGSQGEDEYGGGLDFANAYATSTDSGPDLSYEPAELPGSEKDAPSELPTFLDYLQLYGSQALEGLGSGKTPKKKTFDGGSLRFPSGYSGPRGGGSFRGVGQGVRPDEYLSAEQYEKLMEDRLKLALADLIRDYKINPLV